MASPRNDNVKELILSATESLMESQKLSVISLAKIASAAGISKGTLYYHYKTKNSILLDIMDKYLDEQFHDLTVWTENIEKDTSIHRMVNYILERDIGTIHMRLHFFYDAMLGNEEIKEQLLIRYREFAHTIAEKIAKRTNSISPQYLSWFLLILSDGLFIHQTLDNPEVDIPQFILETARIVDVMIQNADPQ